MDLSKNSLAEILKRRGWMPLSPALGVFQKSNNPVKIHVSYSGEVGTKDLRVEAIILHADNVDFTQEKFSLDEAGLMRAMEVAENLTAGQ